MGLGGLFLKAAHDLHILVLFKKEPLTANLFQCSSFGERKQELKVLACLLIYIWPRQRVNFVLSDDSTSNHWIVYKKDVII